MIRVAPSAAVIPAAVVMSSAMFVPTPVVVTIMMVIVVTILGPVMRGIMSDRAAKRTHGGRVTKA